MILILPDQIETKDEVILMADNAAKPEKNAYDPYATDPNKTTLFTDRNPMAMVGTDIEEVENGTPRDEDDEGDFGCFSSEDSLRKVKQIQKKIEEQDGIESLTETEKAMYLSYLETIQNQSQEKTQNALEAFAGGIERSLFDDPEDRAPIV